MTIQMKATEKYFPVVLFIILYKVVLTFETVDEILKCDHSNESSTWQYFPMLLFIRCQGHKKVYIFFIAQIRLSFEANILILDSDLIL